MFKLTLAALALMALAVTGVSAQDSNTRTITVNGSGSTSGDPDMATITLGVEQNSESIADAYSQVNETLDSVIQQLTEMGINENDIQTTDLSIFTENRPPTPMQQNESGMAEPQTSFRVMNRVTVIVRDLSMLEQVIDTAVSAGANNIFGLNFSIEDPSALEAEARVQALEEARTRAQQIADALNVELGAVQTVVEEGDSFVRPAAESAAMDGRGGAAIERGQLSVTVNVRVSYAIAGDN
jgi:hypothetical protein